MSILSNTSIRAGAAGAGGDYQIEKSMRFGSASSDSSHLSRSFGSGGSVSTWTLSFWIKGHEASQACYIFTGGTGTSSYIVMDAGQLRFYSNNHDLKTNAKYRDPHAWYHVVCVADTTNGTTADRQRVYVNGERITDWATESNVSGSGWALGDFNAEATHYINRLTTGNHTNFSLADVHFVDASAKEVTDFGKTNTKTGQWVPIEYTGGYGTTGFNLKLNAIDQESDGSETTPDDSTNGNKWTALYLRDDGGHIKSSSTEYPTNPNDDTSETIYDFADTSADSGTYPSYNAWKGGDSIGLVGTAKFLNTKPVVSNSAGGVELRVAGGGISASINGGTAVACTNGVWTKISDTFDGTLNSITVGSYVYGIRINGTIIRAQKYTEVKPREYDVLRDSPTSFDDGGNGTGNYCTLSPLSSNGAPQQGNLQTHYAAGNYTGVSSFGFDSGKWYGEFTLGTNDYPGLGFTYKGAVRTGWMATEAEYFFMNESSSGHLELYPGGANTIGTSITTLPAADEVWQLALDCDNGKGWIGKEDTWYNNSWGTTGNPATGANPTFTLSTDKTWHFFLHANNTYWFANFGQRDFEYTKPSDFLAPNTYNLPEVTIKDPSKYFQALKYEGTSTTNPVTGVGFSPDLVWIKNRDNDNSHSLFDKVRGKTKMLHSDWSSAQSSITTFDSFDSDGFTVSSNPDGWNNSSYDYISWHWDAGDATSNTSVTVGSIDGTNPTIASTTRTNASTGFSIVSYTGNNTNPSTVGHSLGTKPDFILLKDLEQTKDWIVYHKELGATKYMYLNTDSDVNTGAVAWNDTEPDSNVWTMQDFSNMNSDDIEYIAYCWSEVAGYSKFGTYTGMYEGATEYGPFVHCGFAPRWIMMKQAHSGYNGSWVIYDTARTPTNSGENWLYANTYAIEAAAATYSVSAVSNGFKLRSSSGENNGNGRTFIYAAFADRPFKYSNAH